MSVLDQMVESLPEVDKRELAAAVISVKLEVVEPVVDPDEMRARDRRAVLHLYAPIKVNPCHAGAVFAMEASPLDGKRTHDDDWFEILKPGDEAYRGLPDVPLPDGYNAMGDVRMNCTLERGLYTRKLLRESLCCGRLSAWRWVSPLQRLATRQLG